MTYKQIQEKNNNPLPQRKNRDLSFYLGILNRVLAVFFVIASLYSVLSINDLAIKGFILSDLKKEVNVLVKENKDLELAKMQLESYENIQKKAEELQLVKVDRIDYITVTEDSVAKR